MSLQKIKCPECGAGMKSASGFKIGQSVCCLKCETYFVVEDPSEAEEQEEEQPKPAGKKAVKAVVADDEEVEEKPKKKKKKKRADDDDDEEGSYKTSPLRFVILGGLVLVMLVLGFLLYQKKKNEADAAALEPAPVPNTDTEPVARPNPFQPKVDPAKLPKDGPKRPTKGAKGPDVGALAGGAVDNLFGGGPAPAAEARKLTAKYTAALVGTWTADLGAGATEQLTYGADGTFRATRTGPGAATTSGKYTVKGLVGTRGLKLQLDGAGGARTITAVFEDDELQHPSLEKGVTASFRKK